MKKIINAIALTLIMAAVSSPLHASESSTEEELQYIRMAPVLQYERDKLFRYDPNQNVYIDSLDARVNGESWHFHWSLNKVVKSIEEIYSQQKYSFQVQLLDASALLESNINNLQFATYGIVAVNNASGERIQSPLYIFYLAVPERSYCRSR